jgi:GT2 family glycosyltransferase
VTQAASRPRVDVGIVTWNTRDLSVQAIRRLLETDQGCDIRVLVRDNGSSDGTAEAVAREIPQATVEAGDENLGFAKGVNRLLALSDAPWFFALNSDAWPQRGAIGRLVSTAQRHPRTALVVPRIERPDGSLEHSTHAFPSARLAALLAVGAQRFLPERVLERYCIEGHWDHRREREVDWAVGAAWLLRREAIEDVGPLDERFFMYAEDLEWCWRARHKGWQVRFDPGALVIHIGDASGAQRTGSSANRTAAYLRNTYRFYAEARGVPATVLFRGLNFAGAARVWAVARRQGDAERAEYWKSVAKVHVSPAGGYDG